MKSTKKFKEWFEWFYQYRWPNHMPTKDSLIKLIYIVYKKGDSIGYKRGYSKAYKEMWNEKHINLDKPNSKVFKRDINDNLVQTSKFTMGPDQGED